MFSSANLSLICFILSRGCCKLKGARAPGEDFPTEANHRRGQRLFEGMGLRSHAESKHSKATGFDPRQLRVVFFWRSGGFVLTCSCTLDRNRPSDRGVKIT